MFRAIGEVDEAMLQDAVAAAAQPVKRRPPVRFGAGLATAACAALLAAAVLGTAVPRGGLASGGTQQAKNSLQSSGAPAAQEESAGAGAGAAPESGALPGFSLEEAGGAGLGMEAVMVQSESELLPTAWPGQGEEMPDALTVYRNARPADVTGARTYTEEELCTMARQTAQALGLAVESVEVSPTEEQRQAPQAAVQADYTFEGTLHLTHFVWDAAASPAQQLLFASCGRLSFSGGESGAILYEQPQPGQALGEYPLVSESEARAMLLQGQCLAGAPYAVQSEADIAAVQLCYREGSEVYAPWYRFWVKLPEEAQQNCAPGCTVYGAYYVPAVRGEYIAGAPAA